MLQCERCFWLDKHKVWKRPSSPFPQLPNGMDRVLKTHFDRFMKQGKLPPELCNNNHCEDMKLFDNEELLSLWRNARKYGINWKDKEGNLFYGAVDNILVKGKKLIVLDYKTKGSALKDEDEAAKLYQNQLDAYNFLLRKNDYETEDYGFLLFYYPKEVLATGEVIFETTLVKRRIDVKNAEALFNRAIEMLNEDCPHKSCVWCEGR
jgi:hypothetical protein